MAYCPTNARSEFVMPANFSGGGVSETTRRFQDASPAFMNPGFKPTRGSGFGATVDMFAPPEDAHAAREHSPTVSPNNAVNLIGVSPPSLAGRLEEQRGQHFLHAGDFGRLVGEHVRSEPVDFLLLARAPAEQLIHHREGAPVMLDHEGQE